MKINKEHNQNFKYFSYLRYGEVFFVGDDLYMKISHEETKPIECDDCRNFLELEDYGHYAVNIATGMVRNFESDERFEPCECEVNLIERV